LANEIELRYKDKVENIDIEKVFIENKNFKIETIMKELIATEEKINKKLLRTEIKTECPTIPELFFLINKSYMDDSDIKEKILINFNKSNHELFNTIKKYILKK
jgi:hypothetical protein